MREYIDRELTIQAVDCGNLQNGIVEALKENIKDVPAADVKPVVRGVWVWDVDGMDWGLGAWVCSHCQARPETTWQCLEFIKPLKWNGSKFCPNCGADMRGGDAE